MVSNPLFFDVVAEEYVSLQKDAEGPVDRSPNSRTKNRGFPGHFLLGNVEKIGGATMFGRQTLLYGVP
jgi:hypothetical protein